MLIKHTYDSAFRIIPVLENIHQVRKFRYLICQLVRRYILICNKRPILGVAWIMLKPLGIMIILRIVCSQLFRTAVSFPTYILSGIIAWIFFVQTTNVTMNGIIWGGDLLHRIYFSPTILGLSAIGTGIVNFALSVFPLLLVMLFTNLPVSPSIVFLPVSMLILAGFTLSLGLIFSTLALYFPDVTEIYQIILTAWMCLTPNIHPETVYPASLLPLMETLNPVYSIVKFLRIPIRKGRITSKEGFYPGLFEGIISRASVIFRAP